MDFILDTNIIYENSKDFDIFLKSAAKTIANGGLVVFPTETVYGLGANALDASACEKIFLAKGRPSDNPLIVHVSSIDMAMEIVLGAGEDFFKLADAFWPGPISFILNKNDKIPDRVSAGLDTVAVRMPNNKTALKLIEFSGLPIAAPSANISGRPSPTRSEHVIFDLDTRVDCIICSDKFPIGVESTVLDLSGDKPIILRPGAVSRSMIEGVLGTNVEVYTHSDEKTSNEEAPRSPGLKYRHYSPSAKVFSTDVEQDEASLERFAEEHGVSRDKLIYIQYDDDSKMARDLFADFRDADLKGFKIILIKPAEGGELLDANLNRLNRAIV